MANAECQMATINEKKSKQWERFQLLKARREKVSKKTSKQMLRKITRSAVETVRKEVTVEDVKDVLQSEGINVTMDTKQKKPDIDKSGSCWEDVKKFLDSDRDHTGTSTVEARLESRMNEALRSGKLDEAVEMSDDLSQVEFASRVTTAIDRHKYVKRKQLEEARKRKKPKLKWRYEHKQRWETKSNM